MYEVRQNSRTYDMTQQETRKQNGAFLWTTLYWISVNSTTEITLLLDPTRLL